MSTPFERCFYCGKNSPPTISFFCRTCDSTHFFCTVSCIKNTPDGHEAVIKPKSKFEKIRERACEEAIDFIEERPDDIVFYALCCNYILKYLKLIKVLELTNTNYCEEVVERLNEDKDFKHLELLIDEKVINEYLLDISDEYDELTGNLVKSVEILVKYLSECIHHEHDCSRECLYAYRLIKRLVNLGYRHTGNIKEFFESGEPEIKANIVNKEGVLIELLCERTFNENSLISKENFPLDLFKLVIKEANLGKLNSKVIPRSKFIKKIKLEKEEL